MKTAPVLRSAQSLLGFLASTAVPASYARTFNRDVAPNLLRHCAERLLAELQEYAERDADAGAPGRPFGPSGMTSAPLTGTERGISTMERRDPLAPQTLFSNRSLHRR